MVLFHVTTEKCEKCGMCAAVCPMGLIAWQDRRTVPAPVPLGGKMCITCGHCVCVCPHGALSLEKMPVSSCEKVVADYRVNRPTFRSLDAEVLSAFEQLAGLVRTRRSTRVFSEEPVARQIMEELINAARFAPTGKNTRMLHWLVVSGREKLAPLVRHSTDWMRDMVARQHPMAEMFGMEKLAAFQETGRDIVLRGAPTLVVVSAPEEYMGGTVDAVIALTTFELLAVSRGLGTCWAGFFQLAAAMWPPMHEALMLPAGYKSCYAMMAGMPKFRFKRLPVRKNPSITWL